MQSGTTEIKNKITAIIDRDKEMILTRLINHHGVQKVEDITFLTTLKSKQDFTEEEMDRLNSITKELLRNASHTPVLFKEASTSLEHLYESFVNLVKVGTLPIRTADFYINNRKLFNN